MSGTRMRVRFYLLSLFLTLLMLTLSVVTVLSALNIGVTTNLTVNYEVPEVLTVYQPINQSDPKWTKQGYNASLNAEATKVESNNLETLAGYLVDNNNDNNPDGVEYGVDDYITAPVYRNIDIVNVDISTGEIIGKLSDSEYNFEWFGREITLPSGTKLASGRTLTSEETFTVDVYTYYPDMYIARYIQDNIQYIRIAETQGAFSLLEDLPLPAGITPVYVKGWYTATFEATIFNADHSVAKNDHGVICRSYIYDSTPVTYGSTSYLITNYNYNDGVDDSQATSPDVTQTTMMLWTSNLTKEWENSELSEKYKTATGVQGENYTAYIYNLLYLVKYADNNSQEKVGYGNSYTNGPYENAITEDFTNANGTPLALKGRNYLSQKGGGTIGVYNSNSANTEEYVLNTESGGEYEGDYLLSPNGYDAAGMNYGYTYRDYVDNGKHGLYATQFLTYTTDKGKRVLIDGYVGSDKYTSVFCLGQANPWGNVWTWIFGVAVASDSVDLWAYINYEDYDYTTQNWVTNSQSGGSNGSINFDRLEDANYMRLSYALPNTEGRYNYLGTSSITSETGIESLIGMPIKDSGKNSGLESAFYCDNSTDYTFGCLRGGVASSSIDAGVFYFSVYHRLIGSYGYHGFRTMLISV